MSDVDIQSLKYQASTTPPEERNRCPECGRVDINRHTARNVGHSRVEKGQWRCHRCQATFEDPVSGYSSADAVTDDG